jgi:hypothetical protein
MIKHVAISNERAFKVESALVSSNSAAHVQTTLLGIGGVWYRNVYHKWGPKEKMDIPFAIYAVD